MWNSFPFGSFCLRTHTRHAISISFFLIMGCYLEQQPQPFGCQRPIPWKAVFLQTGGHGCDFVHCLDPTHARMGLRSLAWSGSWPALDWYRFAAWELGTPDLELRNSICEIQVASSIGRIWTISGTESWRDPFGILHCFKHHEIISSFHVLPVDSSSAITVS